MPRLQYTAQKATTQAHAISHDYSPAPADKDIRVAEDRVKAQEAHVLRLIVQGAPTQAAEDLLRELAAVAEAMRRNRGPRRA